MQAICLKVYVKMQCLTAAFVQDENGQDLIEYALVAALISLAATAGMTSVATAIGTGFTNLATKFGTYTS
jgi:pilus assembly protein Flp/PilA